MKRRIAAALAAALTAAGVLAGCGSQSHPKVATVPIPITQSHTDLATVCSGMTDTCHVRPARDLHAAADFSGGSSGCVIPDVSSYQGHPDWAAAKGSICGAIFKMGEYSTDPDAQYNAQALQSLHIWNAGYWFIRNTGCANEANQIINTARWLGVKVVVNDIEVGEAYGYAACLVPAERSAGLIPVNYTAPGTWPGGPGYGNAPLWQAEYGPTLHPFWQPVVAWQCSDGEFGCVTYVPGVGYGDVSVDYGITRLGAAPPPDPFAIFPTRPVNERSTLLHYLGARIHCTGYRRCFDSHHRNLARYLDGLRGALAYDAHRIAWLASHVWGTKRHPNWKANNGGSRFQWLIRAAEGQLIHVG